MYPKNTPQDARKTPNISYLFVAYNKARRVANLGTMSEYCLNKALGLAQNDKRFAAKMAEYGTTNRWCSCQGFEVHQHCYHLYAVWMRMRANQWRERDRINQMANLLDNREVNFA